MLALATAGRRIPPMIATFSPPVDLLLSLSAALGMGLLVGMQREWEHNRVAGIRTFAQVSLFGALCALLGQTFGGWVLAAGVLALAAIIILGHLPEMKTADPDKGLTTEMAMLVIFAAGAMTMTGHRTQAIIVAGVVMVLLHSKATLHAMVHKIGAEDLKQIARLVLIGLVILPALPNHAYDRLGVLNPFAIWLMVVLIVALSLAAYLAAKFLGNRHGMIVGGLLGGLISSTATTTSLARQSSAQPGQSGRLAVMTLMASAVVFARVILEVLIAAPTTTLAIVPPLTAMMFIMGFIAVGAFRLIGGREDETLPDSPPSQLKGAVGFALLYALVLAGATLAKQHFGNSGMYVVAAISGLTDMDAITLSTAKLTEAGHVTADTAWRVILVGGLANLGFKAVLAATLGGRAFRKAVIAGFGIALATGAVILIAWP